MPLMRRQSLVAIGLAVAVPVALGGDQYGRVLAIIGGRVYVKPTKVRVFMDE